MKRSIIGLHEKLSLFDTLPLSFQHLSAMLWAAILVPVRLGIDPAIALLKKDTVTLRC